MSIGINAGVLALAALLAAGCTTASQEQARQAATDGTEVALTACLKAVLDRPEFAPVAGHLRDLDLDQRTTTDPTDDTIPSAEEARLLATELDATAPCRKAYRDAWMGIRPDLVPIWADSTQHFVAVRGLLVERKITWTDAVMRQRTIVDETQQRLAAVVHGVATPPAQSVPTQEQQEPASVPAEIAGT